MEQTITINNSEFAVKKIDIKTEDDKKLLRYEVTLAVLKAYGLHSFDTAKVEDVINCLVEHYDEIENIISEYQK